MSLFEILHISLSTTRLKIIILNSVCLISNPYEKNEIVIFNCIYMLHFCKLIKMIKNCFSNLILDASIIIWLNIRINSWISCLLYWSRCTLNCDLNISLLEKRSSTNDNYITPVHFGQNNSQFLHVNFKSWFWRVPKHFKLTYPKHTNILLLFNARTPIMRRK